MDKSAIEEALDYDPETGLFTRRKSHGTAKAGSRAGCIDKSSGYLRIQVEGKLLFGHRIAWLLINGEIPAGHNIDHINGDRGDNRISNLRVGTQGQNRQNLKRATVKSRTGFLGVSKEPDSSKYRATITKNGVRKAMLGFNSAEEAHAAYVEAKRRLHEFGTL